MKTYHLGGPFRQTISEAVSHLRRVTSRDRHAVATEHKRRKDLAYERIMNAFGVTWSKCHLLDVGSGQQCTWSLLFGAENQVTAIDYEIVPKGLNPLTYINLCRQNGPMRALKTVVRKSIGIDRRMRQALEDACDKPLPWPSTQKMDCHELAYDDATFDGVFSYSVFEHLADSLKAMQEIERVLKPGGVAYISLETYISVFGAHDPRLWGNPKALPFWSHLRPSCAHLVQPNVYVNKLRISEFENLANSVFDKVVIHAEEHGTRKYLEQLTPEARAELAEYTDEELCTEDLILVAQKSSQATLP